MHLGSKLVSPPSSFQDLFVAFYMVFANKTCYYAQVCIRTRFNLNLRGKMKAIPLGLRLRISIILVLGARAKKTEFS